MGCFRFCEAISSGWEDNLVVLLVRKMETSKAARGRNESTHTHYLASRVRLIRHRSHYFAFAFGAETTTTRLNTTCTPPFSFLAVSFIQMVRGSFIPASKALSVIITSCIILQTIRLECSRGLGYCTVLIAILFPRRNRIYKTSMLSESRVL